MKTLLLILILTLSFQTSTKADGIKDFEIEGISIGDSLLDYFSKEEINKNIMPDYWKRIKDKTFILSEIESNNFNNYRRLQFVFKRSDITYKLYGIHGIIWFEKDITSCKNKLKEISSEIQSSLIYDKDHNFEDVEISGDRGKYSGTTYQLKNGFISIHCTDWSKKIEKELYWVDHLSVNIKTEEYEIFLRKD